MPRGPAAVPREGTSAPTRHRDGGAGSLAYLPHGCSCCDGQLAYVQDWGLRRLLYPTTTIHSVLSRMQGGDDPDAVIVVLSLPLPALLFAAGLAPSPSSLPRNGTKRQGRVRRRWLRGALRARSSNTRAGHRCLQGCLSPARADANANGPRRVHAFRSSLSPGKAKTLALDTLTLGVSGRCFIACLLVGHVATCRCETVNCAASPDGQPALVDDDPTLGVPGIFPSR